MIKVAIIEDIKEIREGLQLLIDSSNGFSCTHVYATAEDAIAGLHKDKPDVVLMDIHLPGINGIEAIRRLKPQSPSTQFIMSTVYEDEESIFESLKAGATGYLLKKISPIKILDAITEVYNGGSPISAEIARKVISSFQKENPVDELDDLTAKEKEVLKELAKGLRYKEIADQQHISIDTVRSHVRHIYEKLQVQSRMEAVNMAFGKK